MALNIRLDRDSGGNEGRTNDLGLIGRGGDGDTVFIRIHDTLTGVTTRVEVPTDGAGGFSYMPSGFDDGRYMIRVFDPATGERDAIRVKLDTDPDRNREASLQFADGPPADPAFTAYSIKGLDTDARGKVTFTDSDGDTVTRTVNGSGDYTVNLSTLDGPVTATFNIVDSVQNTTFGTGDSIVICFFPGTRIATPAGDVAVEALATGDLVLTTDGEARPIAWMGRQTVSTRFGEPSRVLPIRIAAGALAEGLPVRDLLVSADHALLIDGVLVHAAALVNGTTIRRDAAVPEVFTYFHVELADHALILAEGVPAETFIDSAGRLAFDNWHEHTALHPHGAALKELPLPRAKSQRQVPAAARARIAEREAVLVGPAVAAA